METKFDIDDVVYVPATVTKVIKTADGKVSYGLDICDRDEVRVLLSEEAVGKKCFVVDQKRVEELEQIADYFGKDIAQIIPFATDKFCEDFFKHSTWVYIGRNDERCK